MMALNLTPIDASSDKSVKEMMIDVINRNMTTIAQNAVDNDTLDEILNGMAESISGIYRTEITYEQFVESIDIPGADEAFLYTLTEEQRVMLSEENIINVDLTLPGGYHGIGTKSTPLMDTMGFDFVQYALRIYPSINVCYDLILIIDLTKDEENCCLLKMNSTGRTPGIFTMQLDESQVVNSYEDGDEQTIWFKLTDEQFDGLFLRSTTVIDVTMFGQQGYGNKTYMTFDDDGNPYSVQFDLRTYMGSSQYVQFIMDVFQNREHSDHNCSIVAKTLRTSDTLETKTGEHNVPSGWRSILFCSGKLLYCDEAGWMKNYTGDFTIQIAHPQLEGYDGDTYYPYHSLIFTTGDTAFNLKVDLYDESSYSYCEYTGQIPTLQPNTTYEIMANWNGTKWVFQYLAY